MRGDSGQAAVEAAFALPLLVFIGLGLVQLAALQQARIFTEYAAYQAARAGIVWSGNGERMRDAALLALLPTLGQTHDLAALGRTYERARRLDSRLQELFGAPPGVPVAFARARLLGMVRVDTVSPGSFDGHWTLPRHWRELELDGPDTYPEQRELPAHYRWFLAGASEPGAQAYREATVLSIRVRYWYELRIPFANGLLFFAWYAARADRVLHGAVDRATLEEGAVLTNRRGGVAGMEGEGRGIFHARGLPSASAEEMAVLWRLARGEAEVDGPGRRFFLPVIATWSMRMQSNFHRKWRMHEEAAR